MTDGAFPVPFSHPFLNKMPDARNTSSRPAGPAPRPAGPAPRPVGPDPAVISWYAARLAASDALITRRLACDGIHCYRTRFAPGIVFMRCTLKYAADLISEFWGKVYFYLNPERKQPAPIPERQMNNFILVTSVTDDLIPLTDVTEEFLKGDRVRVTGGLFQGAEGVVKRIKGHQRLVVSINCFTAVATCYIRPEFLEKITEPETRL